MTFLFNLLWTRCFLKSKGVCQNLLYTFPLSTHFQLLNWRDQRLNMPQDEQRWCSFKNKVFQLKFFKKKNAVSKLPASYSSYSYNTIEFATNCCIEFATNSTVAGQWEKIENFHNQSFLDVGVALLLTVRCLQHTAN